MPEGPLDRGQALVSAHHPGVVQLLGRHLRPDHVQAVQGGLGGHLGAVTLPAQAPFPELDLEMLTHLVLPERRVHA